MGFVQAHTPTHTQIMSGGGDEDVVFLFCFFLGGVFRFPTWDSAENGFLGFVGERWKLLTCGSRNERIWGEEEEEEEENWVDDKSPSRHGFCGKNSRGIQSCHLQLHPQLVAAVQSKKLDNFNWLLLLLLLLWLLVLQTGGFYCFRELYLQVKKSIPPPPPPPPPLLLLPAIKLCFKCCTLLEVLGPLRKLIGICALRRNPSLL